MGNCVRHGTRFKRHQFRNDGKCKHCGMAKRKKERTARQAFIRKYSRELVLTDGISRKEGNMRARIQWDRDKAETKQA